MYYTYDSLGRKTGYKLSASYLPAAAGLSAVNYTYDDYGRFHSVSSSVNSVSSVVNYSYLENSSLIAGYTSPNGFEVSKYYEDNRNLIVGVSNYFGTNCISSFEYQNDALGRRSQRVDNNIDYSVAITNTFAYNGYSEVTNAIMNTDNYKFTFDDIGNRTQSVIPNNQTNTSVDYENSQLNQCLEANSSNPIYDKSFAFDFDGNMITNDVWAYSWNAENRMTSATNYVDNTYITYAYDYQGRMIKKVTDGETTLFYWNGVQIIAEISTDTVSCVSNYYTWANGETLTASLDGETVFYTHDANKNITDLLDDSGDLVAHYEYSPFGAITEQAGLLADDNPFRFSNEYFDKTTEFVEYKFRPYFAALGKFLSRDPIEEKGGLNLYGICNNDLINYWDNWGLSWWNCCDDCDDAYITSLDHSLLGSSRDPNLNGVGSSRAALKAAQLFGRISQLFGLATSASGAALEVIKTLTDILAGEPMGVNQSELDKALAGISAGITENWAGGEVDIYVTVAWKPCKKKKCWLRKEYMGLGNIEQKTLKCSISPQFPGALMEGFTDAAEIAKTIPRCYIEAISELID